MENNHSMSRVERSRREKVTRYSVRKVSFGAASVAVAAFFMFLGNGAVYAAEPNVTATDSALAATPANNQLDENSGSSEATVSKAQADTTTPTPADASSTSVESATVSKAQADTTTSKPADATPAPVVSSTTSTTEEKSAEKNTEASSAEANSVENKQQTTVKAEEPSATSVATTKPAEETATTESSKPKSRKKRAVDATSVDTVAATSSNENDPLAKNRKNTGQIINGDFSDTSKGATIPTEGPRNAANTYSAVTEDQMVGWKLDKTDGKTNRFDLVWAPNALPAYNYLTFGKTPNKVGANLGLYTNHNFYGGKRKEGSGPIYQDIDVTPGGEAVIRFVGSSVWNANGYNGVQVTVSDASNPGDILYKGSPFLNEAKYGVFRGILNIPANVSKIRLTFSSTVNSSFDTANMKNHLIPNEWGSSVVGDVKVSSGSFVTSSVNNIAYTETATSSSAKVVDSTVSATLTNEGYGDAMDAEYKVVLPKGATYKSGTNVKSYSFDESSRTLTLKIGEVKRDQPVKFDYTITLPADKPTRETLTGHVSYRTKGFSMNERSLSVNQATVGGQEYGIRNEFIKTESTVKQGSVDIPAQTVTVKMYKDDLQTSVTQMEETLKTLNKDDYSTESWNSLQKALRDAKKVLSETDATPIEDRADQDTINNFPILLAKEKAKLDLDKVAKEQKVAIDTKNNATREEKAEAKAKVEDALDKANLAVDAAKTVDDVATIGATQTSKITPIFPVEVSKDAAKAEIQKSLELKNAEINGNDNLTTEEKTTALAEAKKKADEAKALVDGATTDASVERAEISGINKIESYNPAAVEKDTAKKAVEAALKAQEKAIDAKADSTTEEKEAAKEEARAKAEAAKEAIDKADSNANVAAAKEAGVGKITPVVPKAEVKPAAKQAIEDAYTAKVAEIEKRPELTTEEKEAAKAEARKLADAARANVDKAKTDDAVETAKESGTGKVEAVDPAAVEKDTAKKAVEAALKAQEKAIDAKVDSTTEEKEAAKEEARAKAEAAKEAIDKADSNANVAAAKEAGVGKITPVVPKAEVKPAAKQAIEDAYTAKVAEIEKRPELTTEEKAAAKAEARKLADAARANVDKAKTDDAVETAKESGTGKVEAVDPAAVEKDTAKKAVEAALKAQEKAIDAKADSTTEEKEAAKEEARAKAEAAKEAIDKADSNANVAAAKEAGVGKITPVVPKAEVKPAAKQAIEDAYTAKVAEIEKRPELTTEEKAAAKAEARKLADAARANVDKAKTDDAVETAKESGTGKVEAVDPAAVEKDTAKKAVEAALKAQEKAIDAKADSTTEEKEAAKEEARAKAEAAKEAIDKADSNANVAAAKEAGVGKITPVVPKAEVKPAAKQAIEDAYTAKVAEIEKRPELTTEEKAAAKAEARKLADAARANVDKAKTDDAVETAKESGTGKVEAVDPAAVEKDTAKKAVEAALKAQEKAIDAKADSTTEEKEAAKEEARAKAEAAKEAIDKADSNANVAAAKEAGVGKITPVVPKAEVKPAAKQAIEDAYTAKVAEIEKRPELTTEEKAAAKAEARKLADAARANVDKAKTDDAVETAKESGTGKVEAVDPAAVEKDTAKKAVEAALKAQEKAIDAKADSTTEEKEAAKEEARAKAEAAKEAIDKADSNANVAAAKEAGVGKITPVVPKAEVKPAAKQAIEDAYTAKVAEIEKRPELTTEEKEAAKAEARKLADAARANVDKAKTDDAVETAKESGTGKVEAVDPAAVEKDTAKKAVEAALKAQEKAIDAKVDSTTEEKEAAKEEARAKAEAAKEAIDKADSNANVAAAKEAGVGKITPVVPKAEVKPAAKQAIEDAYTAKVAEIEKRPELTTEEKAAAKAEARKLADAAKANVDKAKTDDAVAAAEDKGTTKVADVDPAAKAKPAAKAAVDAALAEKDKAIDANDKLSDAEKSAAKEEAKKAADEAKKAIDAAADQAGVDAKATEGTAAVEAVNPVGKDKAKAAVDAALAEKDKAIDANDKLSDAEKSAAKEEAKKAADEAKKAIDAATDQAGVDAKATEGTDAVAAVNPVGKDKAKAAVDAALAEKDKAIDANDKLSDAEKSAAKEEAKKAADEAKKAIDEATDQAGVDAKATEGTDAVAAVNPVGKDKAKAAVDAALAEKDKAIDANDKLSDAEKSAAKEEAKKAADEAKKAIDEATDQAGVDAKATEGTDAVAAVNPVGKDKAKAAVDAALAEKDKAIDANDKLSDAEKSAAKEEAKKAADEAKKAIDAATDQAGVDAKATEGTDAVAAVNPVGKDKAKAAVDAALAEKDKAIDANDKLSDAEKSAAKEEAKKAADEAKKAIDAAADQAGVDAKATEGTAAVEAVNPVGKDKAKAAVDAALAEKDKAIDANDKLSDAEKSAAKEEAKKAADEAKKAIDAATDQAGVDAKATEGTDAVAAVNPVGKDKAKAAVDAALAEKDKAIDANDKLSDAEKSAAKEEAKKAADEAKKAIDAAADQAGVDAKATEGTAAVEAVNPVGKDKAKAAVDAALAEKDKAIDANDKLSDAEKSAAKEEAKKAADEAKKAIDAATDQAGVDAKATEGTDAVAAVNPVGKDKAKAAVDAALAEKDKAIDANDKLSDAEKSAAKEEAKKAADEAKKAIDAATDQAGVDAKATEGTDAVAAVNPVGKDKAKAAVDAALAEKDKAIDANDKLSDAEKSAAKEEAKKAADEAKKAIDAATDQAGVDAKATEGTDAVAAVNPVGKDKAKAAVDAALAEKDKAIDANDKLSDAEKSAAKEEAKKAADEAKKAIDAAADQAGVDAKATEGTAAVEAVNPVGKDKAKAAVDAALAEKDKAIDANDKLSDAEKSAAKEEAKKAADEAKKAIDAAADQAGVDAKEAEGKAEIAKVTPAAAVEVGKSAAKAEIEKAAKAKEAAIEANDKLSEAAKAAAKAQVAAEAKKAIEAIEKAATEADVEVAKEAGKAEIAKVAPATTDYKAKAKAEVEAELAKKLAELENATDLTEAEKAAAKAQVVNKAKEAIEAIQKAATEADVDQAIRNFVYRISAVIREQEEYDLSKLFVNGSVTVKQGESLTDKDVLSKLNLPSGVEIVKVEKPTTSALGTVMAKVTVKLADGSVEEINVPVEVIVSQNHGNEGNGANNGANNTEAKVNKAKLEGAIHQLDELLLKESAKLDAETAKEANVLSADAKKVFANADATQAEVDAMVKRIEDFMAKVAPSTDHANTANDQSAQTPAVVPANNQSVQTAVVAPATTQAAANASQTVSAQANARKAAKELPNTGTVDSTVAMVAAAASALLGLGLAGRRRKEDEEA